jgi:CubicO group peptidase (beta-lactamase class C family)
MLDQHSATLPAAACPEKAGACDDILDAAIARQRIVGGVLRVARRGEIVYHRAVGLADREAGRAMTASTPFRLASLTKPIIAVATLALDLDLDTPVTRWMPAFAPRFGDAAPPITIRHLLTHTSGLGYSFLEPPDGPYHRAGVSDGMDMPGLALDDNLRALASVPLRFAPGTAFNYSLSYDVLGAVLERAAGASLPDVVARYVTGPLELDLDFSPRPDLAVPYADGSPPWRIEDGSTVTFVPPFATTFAPSRVYDPRSYPSGGAGMVGTAGAFHRFLEAIRTRTIPTVPAARLDEMTSDRIPQLSSPLLRDGWGYGYGVGVLRDPAAAGATMRRDAYRWGGAYGHSWSVDPATETSVVLVTNTAFEGMSGALRDDLEREVHR